VRRFTAEFMNNTYSGRNAQIDDYSRTGVKATISIVMILKKMTSPWPDAIFVRRVGGRSGVDSRLGLAKTRLASRGETESHDTRPCKKLSRDTKRLLLS